MRYFKADVPDGYRLTTYQSVSCTNGYDDTCPPLEEIPAPVYLDREKVVEIFRDEMGGFTDTPKITEIIYRICSLAVPQYQYKDNVFGPIMEKKDDVPVIEKLSYRKYQSTKDCVDKLNEIISCLHKAGIAREK